MISHSSWRSLVYELLEDHPDCLMLKFTTDVSAVWYLMCCKFYYRKHGSASYIVREWLLWVVVVERKRERERERDACDVIDITLKSQVIMHMITSTARRPYVYPSTRSEPSCRVFEVHVKTRSLALERSIEQQGQVVGQTYTQVIDQWRWGSGSFAFAGQTAVDHPAAFRWHASSKKNRTKLMFIPFSNGTGSAFENSLDIGYPLASVPARCTKTTLLETW